MKCCLSDLRYKEVIDMTTGQRLGYVCDAEIDLEEGKIVSLIVPGQKKLGGLLSGDDDYILPWESISRLGEDIILAEVAAQQPRRRLHPVLLEQLLIGLAGLGADALADIGQRNAVSTRHIGEACFAIVLGDLL